VVVLGGIDGLHYTDGMLLKRCHFPLYKRCYIYFPLETVLTRELLLENLRFDSKNARLKCGILSFLLARCHRRELIG
jgi:hypothetical protein